MSLVLCLVRLAAQAEAVQTEEVLQRVSPTRSRTQTNVRDLAAIPVPLRPTGIDTRIDMGIDVGIDTTVVPSLWTDPSAVPSDLAA
ncbi:hypothetical protein [Streptomyces sp. DT171]|uniref:hypothetical protein n=1 Tax=Streptomyces sp. DT171 TaxID=3416524 RepID=UPI003CF3D23A